MIIFIHVPVHSAEDGELFGYASWYGHGLHGKYTASGESFDMNNFTAAHRDFDFGTMVKVSNLENGKSTFVRINDRGPFIKNRIIDLSYAAASELGFVNKGTIMVKIEVVDN
ncbi:MAG: septal ring lytic transglycosylase RlpA family protein [Thermodesulfobacteriota bacterium]